MQDKCGFVQDSGTISQTNIQINDWVGVGYIVKDPLTGAGAYMISGGLGGGRNTNILADWEKFKQMYWHPGAWFAAMIDFVAGCYVALGASLEDGEARLNDEEIQNNIVKGALSCKGMGYTEVGKCTGLVARAYLSAGIDLKKLADQQGTGAPSWTYNLYALANNLNINHSVRTANTPLIGDIIFWNYTYDRNGNCLLSDDKQPTHVGIVSKVDIDGQGTLTFIHAGFSKGVTANNKMNIDMPSDKTKNDVLRGAPKNGCPKDGSVKRSGELFSGFGTIRNQ